MSWYRLVSVGGLEGATTYLAMCGVVLGADRIHQHIVHWLLRYLRLCIPQESVDNNWTALSLWESLGDFRLRYPSGARPTRIGVGLQNSDQEQADRLSCSRTHALTQWTADAQGEGAHGLGIVEWECPLHCISGSMTSWFEGDWTPRFETSSVSESVGYCLRLALHTVGTCPAPQGRMGHGRLLLRACCDYTLT
jgi:hypothetical protein